MPPDFPALEPLARAPPLGLSCGIRREKSYRPVDPLIRSVRFCQKSLAVGGPSQTRFGSGEQSKFRVDSEMTSCLFSHFKLLFSHFKQIVTGSCSKRIPLQMLVQNTFVTFDGRHKHFAPGCPLPHCQEFAQWRRSPHCKTILTVGESLAILLSLLTTDPNKNNTSLTREAPCCVLSLSSSTRRALATTSSRYWRGSRWRWTSLSSPGHVATGVRARRERDADVASVAARRSCSSVPRAGTYRASARRCRRNDL